MKIQIKFVFFNLFDFSIVDVSYKPFVRNMFTPMVRRLPHGAISKCRQNSIGFGSYCTVENFDVIT
jgi:hypothetical protein